MMLLLKLLLAAVKRRYGSRIEIETVRICLSPNVRRIDAVGRRVRATVLDAATTASRQIGRQRRASEG
uniref:Putative secreted protein n=1 Tax=Anopheles darlingi TaxID=43151 RepID=A0A2M4D7C5_ANODA